MPLKTRRCVYQTKRMKQIQLLQLLSPLKFLIPLEWEVISSQSQPVANHTIRYMRVNLLPIGVATHAELAVRFALRFHPRYPAR
jgi:hypothetical protein